MLKCFKESLFNQWRNGVRQRIFWALTKKLKTVDFVGLNIFCSQLGGLKGKAQDMTVASVQVKMTSVTFYLLFYCATTPCSCVKLKHWAFPFYRASMKYPSQFKLTYGLPIFSRNNTGFSFPYPRFIQAMITPAVRNIMRL